GFERSQVLQRELERLWLAPHLSSDQLLSALGDRFVLVYFSDGDHLRLLVVHGGQVRLASTRIDLERLEGLIDDFWSLDNRKPPRELSAALLPPDAQVDMPRRIYVVPDGPVLRIPVAALLIGGKRLVDDHEIVYSPSATRLVAPAATRTPGGRVVLSDSRGDL